MLPFLEVPPIPTGLPWERLSQIHPFGILVAIGVLFGTWLTQRYAKRNQIESEDLRWLVWRVVIVGFIASHVLDVLFYQWDDFMADPLLLLKLTDGIASWGGLVGATAAFFYYVRKKGWNYYRLMDPFAYGFLGAWIFGRLGCSVAHDHIGKATDFFLAVDIPRVLPDYLGHLRATPGPHHDLGLYEMLYTIPLFLLIFWLETRKDRKPGLLFAVAAIFYSGPRFFMDYLRNASSDPRYLGLTFGQISSLVAFAASLWLLIRVLQGKTGEAS